MSPPSYALYYRQLYADIKMKIFRIKTSPRPQGTNKTGIDFIIFILILAENSL